MVDIMEKENGKFIERDDGTLVCGFIVDGSTPSRGDIYCVECYDESSEGEPMIYKRVDMRGNDVLNGHLSEYDCISCGRQLVS